MKNNENKHSEEQIVTWGGMLNEFFWICSGANRKILRQCPTEYSKYFGIGGTIFFTAAMAILSGGYAFYTIFNSKWVAIAFGIFWGLLIFNLDRFIVNTMYSDGKHTISKGELFAGLPRLIIAIFLGIVISTPLEMKIFEDRINSQLVKDNIERTNIASQAVAEGNASLVARRNSLEKERNDISSRLAKADKELKEEGEGSALSGKVGHGPIYRDKKVHRDAIQTELNEWNDTYKKELDRIINQISVNEEKTREDISKGNDDDGFCSRFEAFSNLKSELPSVRLVSVFIMMLFIIIEVAPTFFKMMIASGPYDEMLKEEMDRKKAQAILNVSKINDDANTQIQISVAKNKDKLDAEITANKERVSKISLTKAELLDVAIKEWKEKEMILIKEDPYKYIISHTDNNENI